MPCAETDVVAQWKSGQVPTRRQHCHEEVYLPEDGPTELGANVSIANGEWAEQEARRADSQPGLALWTDGSWDENGGWDTR